MTPKIEPVYDDVVIYNPPKSRGSGKTSKESKWTQAGKMASGGAAALTVALMGYLIKEGYERKWAQKIAKKVADLIEKGGSWIIDKITPSKKDKNSSNNSSNNSSTPPDADGHGAF